MLAARGMCAPPTVSPAVHASIERVL